MFTSRLHRSAASLRGIKNYPDKTLRGRSLRLSPLSARAAHLGSLLSRDWPRARYVHLYTCPCISRAYFAVCTKRRESSLEEVSGKSIPAVSVYVRGFSLKLIMPGPEPDLRHFENKRARASALRKGSHRKFRAEPSREKVHRPPRRVRSVINPKVQSRARAGDILYPRCMKRLVCVRDPDVRSLARSLLFAAYDPRLSAILRVSTSDPRALLLPFLSPFRYRCHFNFNLFFFFLLFYSLARAVPRRSRFPVRSIEGAVTSPT